MRLVSSTSITDVVAELRRAGLADVDDSTLTRSMYSTDASLYRVVPQVVVRPRGVDELLAVAEVARVSKTPLTMRGAGTSIAGNAVGSGIVVDTARHLNRIIEVDVEARTARVAPGVVHAQLQKALVGSGLRYGPDPSTHSRCTIGGMIGNNACGSRALGYGRTSDNIAALDVVTGSGERVRVARDAGTSAPTLDRLRAIVTDGLATIRTEFGTFGRQVSGYSLEHLLPERGFDVGSFLAGSEGTLAVVLEATVDLVRDAAHRHLVVLGYPSAAEAADAVPALLPFLPVACEGLGRRIVDAYVTAHGPAALPDLPRGGGLLYVELAGDEPGELATLADRVAAAGHALAHRHVTSPPEQAILWRIREEGAGLAARLLPRPAHAGWEDAAVPPERLGAYLRDFEALLDGHGVHGVPYGHFGDGCVHIRIDFPLDRDGGRSVFRRFLEDAADLVHGYGGSLSGEHGDGRARSELLPRMYSPQAIRLFEEVKSVFDPADVLNPGVLVRPAAVDTDLRDYGRDLPRSRPGLRLRHDSGDIAAAVHRCTGVGKCLAGPSPTSVMCPSYQATRAEKDSTRGRARALQEMVDGRLITGGWRSPEVHAALDLCLSCKGCANDCPTGIDLATYKSEVLYQAYRGRIRPRSHYILGRLPFWARLISPIAGVVNAALRTPVLTHGARWVAGVDQRRSLPVFARRRFSTEVGRSNERRSVSGHKGRVLLWADSFTEHFSTSAGTAAVRVLQHAGYDVETLARPQCCGLTWITTGQLDTARKLVAATVAQLRPYVAAGIPVVGVEPSCLAVLRSDALELMDDAAAALVAGGVFTLAELLLRTEEWTAPDLAGTTLVVQPHCHHASILGFEPDLDLLNRTGAKVQRLSGCCGLAGNFGVERGHYDVSVAVANLQLLPAVANAPENAVFLADGFSCRTQLGDLTEVKATHLAELLSSKL